MNLNDLNLNRFLYRENTPETSSNIANASNNKDFSSNGNGGVPEPGSIITSVILQSSPSDNRIEINPDDTLKAYNNGEVILVIDKNGITVNNAVIVYTEIETADIDEANIGVVNADEANVDDAYIDTLEVLSYFIYAGAQQPQVFGGEIDDAGNAVSLPPSWLSFYLSTGSYLIIHGLDNTDYQITVSPVDGHFRGRIFAKTSSSFIITFQQTVYGSDTFSVSGGGGGSVTVDGIRISPFEEPVDTGFNFVLINNLP